MAARRSRLAGLALVVLLAGPAARAQQTLFNDPSADVMDPGRVYLELDGTQRFHAGFEGLTLRAVWGPAHAPLEVGLNVGPLLGNGAGGELTAAPTVKGRLFSLALWGGQLSGLAGLRLYVPLTLHAPTFEGYAFVAYAAPFGLRVTAGAYGTVATARGAPATVGATATAEMKVWEHLTLAAEWWQHRDVGLGVVVPLPRDFTFYAAYLLSPLGRAADGVVVEVGKQL